MIILGNLLKTEEEQNSPNSEVCRVACLRLSGFLFGYGSKLMHITRSLFDN